MWRPKLEQIEYPNGYVQMVGWILEDESGAKFTEAASDAIVTGFAREEMQKLADELNAVRLTPGSDSAD